MGQRGGLAGSLGASYCSGGGPSDMAAVDAILIDGLGSAHPLQFRWPVGGESDQGNSGVEGLNHRREVVGGRRARGA